MSESLQMQWLVEDRVRLLTLPSHFTTELFQAFDQENCIMMDKLPYPLFHVIMDVRILETFPPLGVCLKMRSIRHARMGWMLSVGAATNPLMRFFLIAVMSATRIRYKDCESVDEAIRFLQAHDPALPPIETWSLTSLPNR
jgi:hypothetical protein